MCYAKKRTQSLQALSNGIKELEGGGNKAFNTYLETVIKVILQEKGQLVLYEQQHFILKSILHEVLYESFWNANVSL